MQNTTTQGLRLPKPDFSNLHVIHRAILEDDLNVLSKFLEDGGDPNCHIKDEFTPLHIAANFSKAEAVEKLLEYGADANILSPRGHTALHLAAYEGEERIVRALMKCTDLNIRELKDDYTAIHIAASTGRTQALAALCEVADVEAKTDDGVTPLLCAVHYSHIQCIRTLAQAGADVNVRVGSSDHTPLIEAALKDDVVMASTLLRLGANVDAAQGSGVTATSIAAARGYTRTLRVLTRAGADLNILDNSGGSALFYALQFGKPETALLLLKGAVAVNTAYTNHRKTALHVAASKSYDLVVQQLLDKGADLDACDADGDPPLQWAVDQGSGTVIEILIQAGADVNRLNSKTGTVVLSWAIRNGHATIIEILLRHGAKVEMVDLDTIEPLSGLSESTFAACKRLAKGEATTEDRELLSMTHDLKGRNVDVLSSSKEEDQSTGGHDHLETIRYRIVNIPDQVRFQSVIESFQDLVQHPGVRCDGPHCAKDEKRANIVGVRYRCMVCETANFCAKCIVSFEITHGQAHPMIRCMLSARFDKAEDLDDYTKRELVKQQDPHMNAADVKSVLIATTENHNRKDELPEWLFDDQGPTVLLLSQEPDPKPDVPQRGILRYGVNPSEDAVAFYNIDEHANVRVKYQKVGETAEAKLQGEDLVHHASVDLLMDALMRRMSYFDYRSQPEFYQMVQDGQLTTRVIDILPGKFEDKLDIRLRTVEVTTANYTALSYTWKETSYERAHVGMWTKEVSDTIRSMANLRHPVYVQDEKQSYLVIGTGLRDALQRLRSENETVCLWADQICINQNHLEERKMQVENMKYIFNRAARVLVWIGEEDEHTEMVFATLTKISSAVQSLGFMPPSDMLLDDDVLDLPPCGSPIWGAVIEHLARPVFSRCWVIQEIVVAQKVVVRCGQHLIDWSHLARAAFCLSDRGWLKVFPVTKLVEEKKLQLAQGKPKIGLDVILQMKGMREDFQSEKELSLESLIYLTGPYEATDPIDKIYSILGIQSSKKRPQDAVLQPDYSLSVHEAFIKATKAIILESGSFAIWGLNDSISSKTLPNLPSWVPDYSIAHDHSTALNRPMPTPPYHASGDSDMVAVWPHDAHPNLLATSSYKAKTIVQVSQHAWPDTPTQDRGPLVEEWTRLASVMPNYVTGEAISHAFTRTLVADCTFQWRQRPIPPSYHTAIALDLVFTYTTYMQAQNKSPEEQVIYGVMAQLIDEVMTDLKGKSKAADHDPEGAAQKEQEALLATVASMRRHFFVCSDGSFGIGPRDMQRGDEVHVLTGSRTPFVLRRVTAADETDRAELVELAEEDGVVLYTLVGECFVLGLMQGEVLETEGFEWEGIYLC